MPKHLNPKEFRAALAQTQHEEDRLPLLHLLDICPTCRKSVPYLYELWQEGEIPLTATMLELESAMSETAAEAEWPEIEQTLEPVPPHEWWQLAGDRVPITWGVAATAARRSFRAARTSGVLAVAYGRLASAVAEALTDGEIENEDYRAELKAYALAAIANGLRVLGKHEPARLAFVQAQAELDAIEDPADFLPFRAEVYSAMASLSRDQGQHEEALAYLDQADEAVAKVCYRPQPGCDLHLVGKRSSLLFEWGRLAEAEAVLREAWGKITAKTPADIRLGITWNLILVLQEQGQLDEAEARLPECRRLLAEAGGQLEHVRVDWTEARLHLARGRREEARGLFEGVQREFLDRGMALDVALVTLELALLLVQEGEAAEAAEQALAVKPELERLGLTDDAAAAMRIAWEAARSQALEAAVLEELVGRLKDLHRRHGG